MTMLKEADLEEDEAREIFVEVVAKQRTWQQGKAMRNDNKLGRGFSRSSNSSSSRLPAAASREGV